MKGEIKIPTLYFWHNDRPKISMGIFISCLNITVLASIVKTCRARNGFRFDYSNVLCDLKFEQLFPSFSFISSIVGACSKF